MSQDNLQLGRSIYTAWEAGDFTSAEWAHSEIEFVTADGPAPGRWKGLAGMAEAMREWLSVWEDWRVEAEEYRRLDDERVIVLFHFSPRWEDEWSGSGPVLGSRGAPWKLGSRSRS